MTINQLNFRKSRLENKNTIGVWKSGIPGEISFGTGQSIRPLKVVGVYKVAVVVVSPFKIPPKNRSFEFLVPSLDGVQALSVTNFSLFSVVRDFTYSKPLSS